MRKPQSPQLSIVIPVYNEQGSISTLLKEYKKSGMNYNFELICVNNGSTDNTEKILRDNKKKYTFIKIVTIRKNIGYGHGIMTGVKSTSGDIVAWTHADMQTHPSDVFRSYTSYKKQNNKNTIVKGSRIDRPFSDTFISACMGAIAAIALRMPINEINAQPKLFPRTFIRHLSNPPNDFMLDLYFLYKANRMKYTIRTIKVNFPKRAHGKSKWAYSLPSRLRMIKRTLQYISYLASKPQ